MAEPPLSVSLREHLEEEIRHVSEIAELQKENAKDALALAKIVTEEQRKTAEKLMDGMREQAARYPTKEVIDMRTGELGRRVDDLAVAVTENNRRLANIEGRVLSAGAIVVVVVSLVMLALKLAGK